VRLMSPTPSRAEKPGVAGHERRARGIGVIRTARARPSGFVPLFLVTGARAWCRRADTKKKTRVSEDGQGPEVGLSHSRCAYRMDAVRI
jgi:hypothetical protein